MDGLKMDLLRNKPNLKKWAPAVIALMIVMALVSTCSQSKEEECEDLIDHMADIMKHDAGYNLLQGFAVFTGDKDLQAGVDIDNHKSGAVKKCVANFDKEAKQRKCLFDAETKADVDLCLAPWLKK